MGFEASALDFAVLDLVRTAIRVTVNNGCKLSVGGKRELYCLGRLDEDFVED